MGLSHTSDICEQSGAIHVGYAARALQRSVCASMRIRSLWFQCSPAAVHPDLSKWKPISARHTHLCSASLSLIAFCLATQHRQMFPAIVLDHPANVMIPEDRQFLMSSELIRMNWGIYVMIKHPWHLRYRALLFDFACFTPSTTPHIQTS